MSGETGGEGLRREHDTLCQLRGRLDDNSADAARPSRDALRPQADCHCRGIFVRPLDLLSRSGTAGCRRPAQRNIFARRQSGSGNSSRGRGQARSISQALRSRSALSLRLKRARAVAIPLQPSGNSFADRRAGRKPYPTVPVVARHGDFWPGNLIVSGDVAGVVDREAYQEKSNPFHDLLLFATSYGLNVNWKPGISADPIAAFRATFLPTPGFRGSCAVTCTSTPEAIGLPDELSTSSFPVFLAEQALDEARKSRSPSEGRDGGRAPEESARHLWRRLLEEYARSRTRRCFAAGRVS